MSEDSEQESADSAIRDSVITYSTDVVGSSIAETQTNETLSTKPRSINQDDSPRFYRRKRFWAVCVAVNIVALVISIPLIILVIFPAVAQKTVNQSQLDLSSIVISSPNNDTFIMSSEGNVTNGGPFKSTISFQTPVTMFWNGIEIGNVEFDTIHVSGGSATTNISNKTFYVTNETGLSDFSVALLNEQNITISFKSTVNVKALGISRGGISLNKEITLPAGNKLGTPKVVNFTVEQQDNSTLILNVTVAISNPSIFTVPMGKLGLGVWYNGTFISNMVVDDYTMTHGDALVTMIGNATIPESADDRANFGAVMSAYLTNIPVNTTSTGQYAYPDHVSPVSWLTPAVKSLSLTASIGGAPNGPPQLITGLQFGSPSFNFTPEAILFSSNNTIAKYKLPFKVNTNIQQISQNATLYDGGIPLATFQTIQFAVHDDLHGSLTLNIPPSPLTVYPGSETAFESFVAIMQASSGVAFNITGFSNVSADTVIGLLPISNLPFTLNVSMEGFSNFNTTTPTINSVTVIDGTPTNLVMQINATLVNPSNTSISVDGETSFAVVFNNSTIGHANTSLSLVPGTNHLTLISTMDPAHDPVANQLLKNYMGGVTSNVTLEGYAGSTKIQALSLAMSEMKLSSLLPPLSAKLIGDSTMKILDVSGNSTKSVATVTMFNPFEATLNILSIDANITVDGDLLAGISDDRKDNPIVLHGNATTSIPDLPINLNLDRVVLFGLLRRQAQSVGLDTSVIDALITIGKIPVPGVPPTTKIDPDKVKNFDIVKFTETALAKIITNMTLLSTVRIDKYEMPFPYTQLNTVSHTDSSIAKLIPLLSRPIAQTLVDSSTLSFDSLLIQDLAEDSFVTVINGGIKNAGPLPAVITFTGGADLVFNNEVLGNAALPPITIDEGQASLKNMKSGFKVGNKGALAAFTEQILLSDSATWTVSAKNVTVNALKIAIDGISMKKDVSLKGSNGFKDAVTISSYDLPGDAPNGGITSIINATLVNSGSIGISLDSISFDVFAGSTKIGEDTASGLTIAPSASTNMKLVGRLVPQSGSGLDVVAKMFSDVINEKAVPLSTKGTGLRPPVSWLVPSITKLIIDTTLPPIKIGKLVPSVTLNELSMKFTPDTAYDPVTSSKEITAQIHIPFGFTLNIQEMSEEIVLVNGETNMAKLVIPKSKSKTIGKNVTSSYSNVNLEVFGDAHESFNSFVKDLTIGDSKTFGLVGSADTTTQTPIGTFPLNNITIDVQTSLLGFRGFHAKPVNIYSLDVVSGSEKTLTVPITTSLFNPSPITISLGDVTFTVVSTGIDMGSAVIKDLNLAPGNNNISATTFITPPNSAIGGILLSRFIANITQPLSIVGTEGSTNVDSLKEALSQTKIDSELPALGKRLLLSTYVTFQNNTLATGIALGGFTLTNPFTSDITISQIVYAEITFHGIPVGSVVPISVPVLIRGHSTFTSPPIPVKVFLDPNNLVKIIKAAADDKKIDITPLKPLLDLLTGGKPPSTTTTTTTPTKTTTTTSTSTTTSTTTPPSKRAPSDDDESPVKLLERILGTINAKVNMSSNVLIDKFPAPLSIVEEDVPSQINSVDILVNQIATPIAQGLVGNSKFTVNTAVMSHEQAISFNLHINGVVSNVGKVKAKITFPSGLKVSSAGQELGISKMPPITSDGSGSAKVNDDSAFQITNAGNFAQFALVLLGGPSASWTLVADDVKVDAFGISLSGIHYNSTISLQGFNGLKQLTVTKFEIPGVAPDGNFELAIDSLLVNPANVGMELGAISFNVFLGEQLIGPIKANGVTLVPKSTTKISFTGEITIKDPKILSQVIAALFSGNGTLTVKGDTINPPGAKGDVPWLSGPFKLLSLPVPISGKPPVDPIKSVDIKSLDLAFTVNTAFDPDSSSSGIVAEIQLPIKLPTPITSVSQKIQLIDENGGKVASLDIPSAPATQKGDLVTTTYSNIPLKAIDQKAFSLFIGELTIAAEKKFNLSGTVIASMGKVTLPEIPFNVQTSMKGLQALRGFPTTIGDDIKVLGGSAQGVTLGMDVSLFNPSEVQVSAGDLNLDVIFEGQKVGSVKIQNITLVRGKGSYPATFLFSPSGDAAVKAGADLLGNFLTNKSSALSIKGNGQTTNIASLAPTFSLLSLDTTLNGLPVQIIESITVTVDSSVLKTKQGLASFVVVNPLNAPYSITGIVAKAFYNGSQIGLVNVPSVPPIEIGANSNKTIPGIPFTFTMNVVELPGLIGKTIDIDLDATSSANLGAYKSQIHITESKVPVTILGSIQTTTTTTGTTKPTVAIASKNPVTSMKAKSSMAAPKNPSTLKSR